MEMPTSRTAAALLEEIALRFPDHEAVVDGTVRLTYAALQGEARAIARGLHELGIGKGDAIGILMGNRHEWIASQFAIMMLGGVVVGLNTWASARELGYQLAHGEVRALILERRFPGRDFQRLVDEARSLAGGLPALRVIDADEDGAAMSLRGLRERGAGLSEAAFDDTRRAVGPDDIACLLYTSGSTATPKGVQLRHRGLIENMWQIGERLHLTRHDRLWLAVSLFWSLGSVNAVFSLLSHAATIVLQHHFDAGEALRLIEAERCSVFYGTPNMALAMTEHPDLGTRDLSALRTGVTIGSPEQIRRIAELGAAEICNVYGLTEAYGNSAVSDAAEPLEKRLLFSGRALDGVEIEILEPETRTPLGPGEIGEIALRGPLMAGYLKAPELTATAFDGRGFLLTGDLGLLDGEGYLQFQGRLKEMVKTGGINVAPAEVEAVLSDHPAVELALVTAIPDSRLDEAVAAAIVLKAGAEVDGEALRAHCREHLAAYKLPRQFRFVSAPELPLTSTGKLQRSRLPELFED